ncbi:MAG: glycosyl transferase [Chryseobacterium sp.]|nr:MAG: glycosyl transferase [Chryseobacterium sp.]
MKVAIVQEWLVSVGGSDKVVKAISDIFPDADIYTLVANKEVCDELGIDYSKVHTSMIQKLPFGAKKHRMYLPLFPYVIEQFDLRDYDVIISSSHAVAKGVLTKSDQLHICYCHSPVRYVWDMYNEYLEESNLAKGFKSMLARYLLHRIRKWDVLSSFRVDYFISNSNNVGKRIKKTYRRESVTIYPNIDISNFTPYYEKEDFYLTSSRLVPYKKIDLIVKAFNQMPDKKLVVIGSGPDYEKIKKMAKSNIKILGYQPFEVLKEKMQKAKAFVFAADEDFGMIPIEAQACATPVIAYGKGGSLETVLNNETGIYFYKQTSDSIIDAVSRFEKIENTLDYNKIRAHAEKFSEQRFKEEFESYVTEKYNEFFKNK